jgi:hypothetical protein
VEKVQPNQGLEIFGAEQASTGTSIAIRITHNKNN